MTTERKAVTQCKSCPWKTSCVPERDIPGGYCTSMHEELKGTCTDGVADLFSSTRRIMACHYSKPGAEVPCAGWLHNQLGEGNNVAVRLDVAVGRLPVPNVEGDQHPTFEDTLPRSARSRRGKSKKLCPNCSSDKHLDCCERCGRVLTPRWRGHRFCSMKCKNLQAAADKLSAQMEEENVNG